MEKEENSSQIIKPRTSFGLRFALIWVVFFAIAGMVLQSIQAGVFVFGDFFGTNYINWFKSFGSFSNTVIYPSAQDFIFSMLIQWYYFFFTGGLISLIWAILSWIIHFATKKKTSSTEVMPIQPLVQSSIQYEPQTQVAKDATKEDATEKPAEIKRIESVTQTKIEEWLEMGLLLLSEGNIESAELIYEQISRAYDIDKDISHETYKRILDFYYELKQKKK